ncbi:MULTISPECIES: diacylglycerol kinase [Comamonas]|uniref:diacylglycerol kinase n=1 Tax=Comamonas TaxID=283 RepID=UPI0015FBCB99|nr:MULTISPECIES: diacylglycerol kinase [Comamonas]UUC95530.1 diacylglycerol kinase [Comamonas sp. C11]WEE79693.1 diacylglycerol kinase [Comamonas testosteroni]
MSTSSPDPVNPQKSRTGLSRVLHAGGYSLAGLKAGWHEKAFQQEAICAAVMLPLALWLGQGWEQTALLAGTVILVLIVELLNTGIEAAIDRIGPEWHELSKKAKDMGSAAVFLALCLCGAVWAAALYHRFIV